MCLRTTRMAKRTYSALEAADMLMEDDIDLDEPIMEGSDDEFSDFEWSDDDENGSQDSTSAVPSSVAALTPLSVASTTVPSASVAPTSASVAPTSIPSSSGTLPATTPISTTLHATSPSTFTLTSLQPASPSIHQIIASAVSATSSLSSSAAHQASASSMSQSPVTNNNTTPLEWSQHLSQLTINPFNSATGPVADTIPDTPLGLFHQFFTTELLDTIVEESNRYAREVKGESCEFVATSTDYNAFFGFHLLMAINDLPAIEDYWKRDELLHYSPVADRISRDYFRELSRYLHFTDNSKLQPRGVPGHDRLGKVRPILTYLEDKFAKLYLPHREMSVDEAMIKFQGRSSLKQYMPLKPIKRGIKVWVLADAKTGYFWKFQVYTGKKEGGKVDEGLCSRVVKELTCTLAGQNHHVYFDNFFTSAKLLLDLETNGIYSCGTARKNRTGFPQELLNPKLHERGDSVTVQKGNIAACTWQDNKAVTVMFTNCQPTSSGTVLRRQRDGSRKELPCPQAIINYNLFMGGVDKGDQSRGYYTLKTKSRKFYKYIFFFLLDVAITNAYLLHKHHAPTTIFKHVKDFRLQLARELIGNYCSRRRPGRAGGIHQSIPLRHFPTTLPVNGTTHHKRGRCKVCKARNVRKDTIWHCKECQVWLCHNGDPQLDCFLQHHRKILQH